MLHVQPIKNNSFFSDIKILQISVDTALIYKLARCISDHIVTINDWMSLNNFFFVWNFRIKWPFLIYRVACLWMYMLVFVTSVLQLKYELKYVKYEFESVCAWLLKVDSTSCQWHWNFTRMVPDWDEISLSKSDCFALSLRNEFFFRYFVVIEMLCWISY